MKAKGMTRRQKAMRDASAKKKQGPTGDGGSRGVAIAYSSKQVSKEPSIQNIGSKGVRIRHRELVSTISGTTSFGVGVNQAINPGNNSLFPWLSSQANSWEQYRFHRIRFCYIPRCATTTVGSVMLTPDYDSVDAPPASEADAMTYRDSSEDVPWKDQSITLDPSSMFPIGPRKFVRPAGVMAGDLKTYDAGRFFLCTTEMADTTAVGKLWVEYDVELFVPQTTASTPTSYTVAQFNLSASQSLTSGASTKLTYDEEIVNELGIVNSTGTFTLPAGAYLVYAQASCAGGTATTISLIGEIQKNDADLTANVESFTSLVGADNAYSAGVTCIGFVTSNGTDTVRFVVTYTSSTGTLVATVDRCRIIFQVV